MSLHSNLYPECGEYYKKDRNDDLYSSCGITKSFDCKFRVVGLMAIHEEHIGVEGGMGWVGFGFALWTIFIWLIYHK